MISTLRFGPSFLVLGTHRYDQLRDYFTAKMNGKILSLKEALDQAEENTTIVVVSRPGNVHVRLKEVVHTILVNEDADQILVGLLNQSIQRIITDARLGPGAILMRVTGDYRKTVEKINEIYQGRIMSLVECLDEGTSGGSIISFTEKPLNRRVCLSDLKQENILLPIRVEKAYRELRSHALRYLTEALEGKEWHELLIRIYDKFSAYDLHFERMMLALNSLEVGMDLGETWTKEYARVLLAVVVYQVRYVTLLPPVEIKKILMGLEYLENGGRIVDYDVYVKNQKITWPEAVESGFKNKKQACLEYRKRIMDRLTQDEKRKMTELEEAILKTRS